MQSFEGGNRPKADPRVRMSNGRFVRTLPVRSSRSEVPLLTSTTETQNFPSLLCNAVLTCLAASLLGFACRRGERPFGPSRIRPCGLTAALRLASRFARLASTFLPGRSAGLRSGLFWPEAKTIPPLHPSPASGRPVCLLGSGKPTVKTHTHERGSISSGWPPNQPASRIAKLFGEGRVCGKGRSRA